MGNSYTTTTIQADAQNNVAFRNTFDVNTFMAEFDDGQSVLNRYSPVIQKDLGAQYMSNIVISGKFRTNYDGNSADEESGMSFILVRKNNIGVSNAYAGFGVAWRPIGHDESGSADKIVIEKVNPGSNGLANYYDIDAISANIPATPVPLFMIKVINSKTHYIPFEYEEYSANRILNCYIPNVVPTNTDSISIATPNVFIVDTEPVCGDNFMNNVINSSLTNLGYINSGTAMIEKDKDYYYYIAITEDNELSFYVSETEGEILPVPSIYPAVTCGARVPMAEYLGTPNMTSFGISVLDTYGYQWWYDDLKITKLSDEYACSIHEIDTSQLGESIQVDVSAYGEGNDGYGVGVSIWNSNRTSQWDLIGSSSGSTYVRMLSSIVSKADYESNGMVTIMIRAAKPSGGTAVSSIHIDYISVRRSELPGYHAGGCMDIYIDEAVSTKSITSTITDGMATLDVSDMGSLSGISINSVALAEGYDYKMYGEVLNGLNSTDNKYYIRFRSGLSGEALITYWESPSMDGMTTLLRDDKHKYAGVNVMVRHKTVYEIAISVTGSTEISVDSITDRIKEYIDSMQYVNGEKIIRFTDIIAYLMSFGTRRIGSISIRSKYCDEYGMHYVMMNSSSGELTLSETDTYRFVAWYSL